MRERRSPEAIMIGADESLRALIEELTDGGLLTAAWRPSFLALPRRMFIPDTIWREVGNGDLVSVSRSEDPGQWEELIARIDDEDGQRRKVVWFVDPWSRSWASLTHLTPDASDDHFAVQQHGPRQLFDEIKAAYRWWTTAGSPGIDRWCITITPDGQRIDLHR